MTFMDPESLTPDDWNAVSEALGRKPEGRRSREGSRTYQPDRREPRPELNDRSAPRTEIRSAMWALVLPAAVGLIVGLFFGLWWLAFFVLAAANIRYLVVGARRRSHNAF